MTTRRRPSEAGMSTLEALVGGTLSLAILAVAAGFFSAQQKGLAVEDRYAEAQNVTRVTLDLMAREIRMASYDPSGAALTLSNGASCPGVRQGIVDATPTRIRFRSDLNGDGDTLDANEDVAYSITAGTITRQEQNGSAATIVSGAVATVPSDGLRFRYYDGSNPPVELPAQGTPPALTAGQRDCVAKVSIVVHADLSNPDPNRPGTIRTAASTEVAIRNRSLSTF